MRYKRLLSEVEVGLLNEVEVYASCLNFWQKPLSLVPTFRTLNCHTTKIGRLEIWF
ncbi:MAG: hypothetical protein RLZZ203_1190 [Cyanobacteriota bacterium]|jgi:hypothetical protein